MRVRAHELRSIVSSLVFKENFAIPQVLRAEIWTSQTTFFFFCPRNITHRSMILFPLTLWWPLNRSCNASHIAVGIKVIYGSIFFMAGLS